LLRKIPEIKTVFIFFLGFFFLSADGANTAPKPKPFTRDYIKKVRLALNHIKPFKVTFVQQVTSDQQLDLEESGEILFKNNKQLKWTYTNPDFKVFLLEGDNYKFYDEDSEQLIIGKVKQKNRQWIWQLLFSDHIVPHARWLATDKTIQVMIPADELHVDIVINDDFLPVKVTQHDPSGVRMVFHFKQYSPNITVSPDTFQLKVPDDVDVIHE
jgi:outer membrane lipoprotein-sorting protein